METGKPAPDFSLKDMEENEVKLSDFKGRVVLIDFWAAWCGPCKAMAPAFEQAARTLEGKVKFAKLNTDDEQQIAQEFGIRSIPTMILFSAGSEAARHSGAMSAGEIEAWLEPFVQSANTA